MDTYYNEAYQRSQRNLEYYPSQELQQQQQNPFSKQDEQKNYPIGDSKDVDIGHTNIINNNNNDYDRSESLPHDNEKQKHIHERRNNGYLSKTGDQKQFLRPNFGYQQTLNEFGDYQGEKLSPKKQVYTTHQIPSRSEPNSSAGYTNETPIDFVKDKATPHRNQLFKNKTKHQEIIRKLYDCDNRNQMTDTLAKAQTYLVESPKSHDSSLTSPTDGHGDFQRMLLDGNYDPVSLKSMARRNSRTNFNKSSFVQHMRCEQLAAAEHHPTYKTDVHVTNKLCLNFMNILYPLYEFSNSKKIRTLIDTARNAGVFHFLLQFNGPCDYQKIKANYLLHLIEKRNKTGELCFPKLRRKLISCWGSYAWDRDDSQFDPNNHIILSPSSYRGRSVSENNVQEFISDLVTKYIPSDCPPWQIIIIRTTKTVSEIDEPIQDEIYYVLVKVHHLLLAEEKDLHISEILMLNSDNSALKVFDHTQQFIEIQKLSNFVESPKHIPNLWNQILMTTINRWNEFIYRYDPLESPDVDKNQQIQCVSQLISIVFITIVTVCTDFTRGYKKTNNQIKYKLRYFWHLFRRESIKRNLTIQSFVDSLTNSANPINILKNIIKYTWYIIASAIILSPYYFIREMFAFKDIIFTGHTNIAGTFCGFISIYIPLIYCAAREIFYILIQIIKAPKNIFEELFLSKSKDKNIFQSKSFSGRKVISFSKSIDLSIIRNRLNLNELGETEYIFSCLGGSLKKYLQLYEVNYNIPDMLNVTCRSISREYFLEKYNKTKHIGGVVFLQLPIETPNSNQLKKIQKIFNRVREKQIAIYLISMGQTKFDILTTIIPDVLMKIFINYFSYNFPITITELHGSDITKLKTNWGQNVTDILFFRPPQSKTCLSLNIHRFGNKTRLAVMADNQLAPDHTKISNNWETYMEETDLID